MSRLKMKIAPLAVVLCAASCGSPPPERGDVAAADPVTIRVALFNIREMSTEKLAGVDMLGVGRDAQLRAASSIVQRVRPDILVINEIDHDYAKLEHGLAFNAQRFGYAYLATGEAPIDYPYAYAAACNTGLLTGLDLNGDGQISTDAHRGDRAHGDDCYGWGTYPGQYAMAVLSRYPLAEGEARTFQNFLWKDLPGNHISPGYYDDEALAILRLSSKSHWDLPVEVDGQRLHLWLSHPTPTVFDGDEDRNGRRNFDEIKLWADYINGAPQLYDDDSKHGGYDANDPFIIMGDLNARPGEESSRYDGKAAIDQLLEHPRLQDPGDHLTSRGAITSRKDGATAGPPAFHDRATAPFSGGMRIDYILPSRDVEIIDGGVFWPSREEDAPGAELAETASDHRLLWLDVRLPLE